MLTTTRSLVLLVLLTFASACKTADYATPEESARMEQLEVAAAGGDEAAAAELAAMEDSIAERTVGGFVDWIDTFVPAPLEPFKGWLVGLGAALAFKRPRRRLSKAAKAAVNLNFKEVGSDLLKTVGLKHSSDDPKVLLEAAARRAEDAGDTALAARIRGMVSGTGETPG